MAKSLSELIIRNNYNREHFRLVKLKARIHSPIINVRGKGLSATNPQSRAGVQILCIEPEAHQPSAEKCNLIKSNPPKLNHSVGQVKFYRYRCSSFPKTFAVFAVKILTE